MELTVTQNTLDNTFACTLQYGVFINGEIVVQSHVSTNLKQFFYDVINFTSGMGAFSSGSSSIF